MSLLKEATAKIGGLDKDKMEEAQNRLDSLTKPPGSLGQLEDLVLKLAGITGKLYPEVSDRRHILMAGDHGVVAEGVSAFPQEVTVQMVHNFLNGGAAVNVLAKQVGAEVMIVDIGVAEEIEAEELVVRKVKAGTDNLAKGPAMTRKEAKESVEVGIELAEDLINQGADILSTGEMGIGNTTPSSAILAAVTGLDVEEVVGYGTGVDEEGLKKKQEVVEKSLELNNPDSKDGLDVLAKVGGLEIGGMAGVMLGAAANGKPVVVDGLISGAAALIAKLLAPEAAYYMLPSHQSKEPGHIKIYQELGLKPMLDLEMRLGEGTGALLGMELVEAAVNIIEGMATFEEAGI